MLKIQNNRIFIAGGSICLPEGLYITKKFYNENDMVFTDKDNSFYLILKTEKLNKAWCKSKSNRHMLNTTPLTLNGLSGHYILYSNPVEEVYDALFYGNLSEKGECLRIIIKAYLNKTTIKNVMKNEAIVSFFCDIRAE